MANYTNVPKPIASNYTNTNTTGKQQYDQSDITYDSPSVFYDGVNAGAYTNVPKPKGAISITAGMATGLLMPPTYSFDMSSDNYTRINKPT